MNTSIFVMGREREQKRNFSLAISLVLVAAMFSFYLSPQTTGQYAYEEKPREYVRQQVDRFEGQGYTQSPRSTSGSGNLPVVEGAICGCSVNTVGLCPEGFIPLRIEEESSNNCATESRAVCQLGATCYETIECVDYRTGKLPREKLPSQLLWGECST